MRLEDVESPLISGRSEGGLTRSLQIANLHSRECENELSEALGLQILALVPVGPHTKVLEGENGLGVSH